MDVWSHVSLILLYRIRFEDFNAMPDTQAIFLIVQCRAIEIVNVTSMPDWSVRLEKPEIQEEQPHTYPLDNNHAFRPLAMFIPCNFLSCSLILLLRLAMPLTLSLRELSILRRILLELLLRRARLASSGPCG